MGLKGMKWTGSWKELHDEQLHILFSLLSIIRVLITRRMAHAGHTARMCEMRNVYKVVLAGKPEGGPIGRHRTDRRITLEWILGEKSWGGFDSSGLIQTGGRLW
jgi:hypothetical protein